MALEEVCARAWFCGGVGIEARSSIAFEERGVEVCLPARQQL